MIENQDIQVEIGDIQLGMFVTQLDIPWEGSGFLLQGFLIVESNFDHLTRKCHWVMVSERRSLESVSFARQLTQKPLPKAREYQTLMSQTVQLAISHSKKSLFQELMQTVSDLFAVPSNMKPSFGLTVYGNSKVTNLKSKQDLLLAKKASKVRSKFQDDTLASKVVEFHSASVSIKEEKAAATTSKKNLINSVEKALSFDVENAATMNIVLSETKESVGSIVESMIRNPEAMRLVDNIRQYDNASYKHAVDVCVLMIAFGRELHLPKDDLIELGIGGLLHDLGEVKPQVGKQTNVKNIAMFSIYKNHVQDGIDMLKNSAYSEIVKTIIAEHHEHYDGTGYPNKLCCIDKNPRKYVHIPTNNTKPISMYGRMIAIVDNYVSLTYGRSNIKPVLPSEAMSYIMKKAGTEFDPALCDVFSQVIGVYPVGSYVELNTNEIAVVVLQNRAWRLSPVIKVVTNEDRKKIPPFVVDLMSQQANQLRSIKKDIVAAKS